MKAVKNNKVYTITEEQQKFYADAGYDILGEDGTVLIHGRGKTVPYEKYAAAAEEARQLREQTGGAVNQEEVFKVLMVYCQEHEIDLGKTTTVSGALKKIKEAGE